MKFTNKITRLAAASFVASLFALCAPAAHATLILTLTDNVTNQSITITDNQPGDVLGTTGQIGFFWRNWLLGCASDYRCIQRARHGDDSNARF